MTVQGRGTTGRTALLGGALGLFCAAVFLFPSVLSSGVPARGDLADFFWPMKAYTAARWHSGVPLWNPLSGCGEPWLAQLQSGVFYPLDLVFQLPGAWGPLASIALHLVVAASGMAAWLFGVGTSRAGALLGAATYATGGAFLSLVLVYNNFETAAFLPWLFAAARTTVGGGTVAGFAAAFALSFLGGEPALAVAGAGCACLFALTGRREEFAAGRSRRPWLRVGGGLLLGVALVAAAALPFLDYVASSGRLTGVTRAEALARPVGSSDLVDLVLPPEDARTRHPSSGRGGYLATLALSPLALVLAAGAGAGLASRPRLLLSLALLAVLGFLLAAGSAGGILPVLWDLGIARGVRFPARWFVLTLFALAALAGAGLDGWRYGRLFAWPRGFDAETDARVPAAAAARTGPLFVLGSVAVALLALGIAGGRASGAPALAALLASAAGLLVLASLRWTGRPGPAVSGVLLLALVTVPLLAANASLFTPSASGSPPPAAAALAGVPGRFFPIASDGEALAALSRATGGEWGGAASARARAALSGYTNLPFGLASASSPSPIGNPRLTRFLGAALAGGNAETILSLADVRHVVSPFPLSLGGARLERREGGVSLYGLPRALGRVFFARSAREADDDTAFRALAQPDLDPEAVVFLAPPAGPMPPARPVRTFSVARIALDVPEHLTVDAESSEPGYLVLTRTHARGWEARLDGTRVPLLRADLALSAILLPAGAHRLDLAYRPAAFRVGAGISIAAVVLLAGVALAGRSRP